jgi:tripartite-type tricarboxylate transporter receptor subunit TctC
MAAWRGIAAPKGISDEVQAKLLASLKKAHESKEFKEFMTNRGFGVLWAPPAEFAQFMARSDADLGATMKAVGIAK